MSLTARDMELRQGRITGSLVAAALGLHPFKSPVEAWQEITGQSHFAGNDLTELGSALEPGLAEVAVARLGGPEAIWNPGTVLHPEHGAWWAATPDVLIPGWQSGIQIKTHTPSALASYQGRPGERGEFGNELIPPYHNMQVQWEIGVFGAPFWYLAAFFNIADFRLYKIRRDDALLASMADAAQSWWAAHVDPAGPQTEPTNEWRPEVGKGKQAPRKKSRDEWINTPIGATP